MTVGDSSKVNTNEIIKTTYAVIAKVFRQADSDETGTVDASLVPDLAAKVIGSGVRESETHLIRFKAESKAGE